jgi:hypothetical protein
MDTVKKPRSQPSSVLVRPATAAPEWLDDLIAEEEASLRGELPTTPGDSEYTGKPTPESKARGAAMMARLHRHQ